MSSSGTFAVPAPFASSAELTACRLRFHTGALAPDEWNHATQLAIVLGYVRAHGVQRGARIVRDRWRQWVARHSGNAESRGGYHDTLIGFLVHITGVYVVEHPVAFDLLDDIDELLAQWGDPELPLNYYSLATLFSDEARAMFVEPDLRPLPSAFGQ